MEVGAQVTAYESVAKQNIEFYKHLAEQGFVREDTTPRDSSWQNMHKVKAVFIPTERFPFLGLRTEGNCYFNRLPAASDIKVVREDQHHQHKDVTVVLLTFQMIGYNEFTKMVRQIQKVSAATDRKARVLVVADPFREGKAQVKRWDIGNRDGNFESENVPKALLEVNMVGPEALRR